MPPSALTRPRFVFATLAFAGFAYSVSQTLLVPSLPDIEAAFGATPSQVTALMTSFWIAGAVTAGIFGRLGDMFGKRLLMAVNLGLFSLGALACAVAPSLLLMIGGRILMGCGVALFPLAFSVVRDVFPQERVAGAIALLGGLIASGAAVGQSCGGLVTDHLGFRAVFWVAVALGVVALGGMLAFVPESGIRTGGRVDVAGALLLALGLGAPLLAVAQAPAWGWGSTRTLALLAVGVVVLAVFARLELRRRDPLIDVPTLLLPRIRMTNVATLFVGIGFFGFSTILTQFFQEPASTGYGAGASATQAGLYLLPGILLLVVASPLGGRLSNRVGPVLTFRLGIVISTIAMLAMTASHTATWELYAWPGLMYLGIGFAFGAMPTIILQNVPRDKSGQSSAINQIIRTTGSAIGVQIAATLITMSIGTSGAPSEAGYTAAFALATAAGVAAFAISLAIPSRSVPVVDRVPAPVPVD